MFERPHHRRILQVLSGMDADFLRAAACCFGGGTCLALVLGEHRESVHIDFLCAATDGYRSIRSTVSSGSLGVLFKVPPGLLREVRADRYGIRTLLEVEGVPIRFEVVLEGRIPLRCAAVDQLPVPVLDRTDLFAEKLLANCDRWADRSTFARDVIDLLVMSAHWGPIPPEAIAIAGKAYGAVVQAALERAMRALADDPAYLARCFDALSVTPAAQAMVRERLGGQGAF
jgi:hypothetical protein